MSGSKAAWWKGTRGEWYVVAQFGLLAALAVAPLLTGLRPWPAPWSLLARIVGALLGLAGAALALAGVLALGPNLTALPHPRDEAQFVEAGAYRWVRHPIYSGILLGSIGWALLTNSLVALAVAAVLFVLFEAKASREERLLRARFPDYADYARRVRRLIPFIH